MSSINQLTGSSASTVATNAGQEFTPEQLDRIKSAVNDLIPSPGLTPSSGALVMEYLRIKDLMAARSGPITLVEKSSPIGFLSLPAEVRNRIYYHCLVVGKVFPRCKPYGDHRMVSRKMYQSPQTQLFLVCQQVFRESAPMYFGQNKFVVSRGRSREWPWSRPLNLHGNPVSTIAYQNIRSMSIAFDAGDLKNALAMAIRVGNSDFRVECSLEGVWKTRTEQMQGLQLHHLDISLRDCNCPKCGKRMVKSALSIIFDLGNLPDKIVLNGFVSKDDETRKTRVLLTDEYGQDLEDENASYPYSIVVKQDRS